MRIGSTIKIDQEAKGVIKKLENIKVELNKHFFDKNAYQLM